MSGLPKGWVEAALEDMVASKGVIIDGDWIETKDQDQTGDVRLTQLADIGVAEFRNKSNRFLTTGRAEQLNCTFLRIGDVLIARMPDPLGRACIFPGLPQPAVTVVDVLIWRSGTTEIMSEWIVSAINSPATRSRIVAQAGGTTRQRISGGNLKRLTLPVPPLAEQKRIVAKLHALSAKSARARTELARIETLVSRYKQAVLSKAFSGELTADNMENFPSLPDHDYFGQIDERTPTLIAIPKTWKWIALGAAADVSGGLTKNSSRDTLPLQLPYLRVANVYANELRLDDISIIGCSESDVRRTSLKDGDLLLVEGNGSLDQIGRVALWQGQIANCVHQNHLIKIRPKYHLDKKYALYWLLSPMGRRAIEAVAASSAGLHTLSLSKVNGLPLPLCSVSEQHEIVRRIETAFARIDRLATEAKRALTLVGKLDEAILAKAFRGELVSQDENDEPASVLLDRIRAERAAAPKPKRGRTSRP